MLAFVSVTAKAPRLGLLLLESRGPSAKKQVTSSTLLDHGDLHGWGNNNRHYFGDMITAICRVGKTTMDTAWPI